MNFTKSPHSSKTGITLCTPKSQGLIASKIYSVAFLDFRRSLLESLHVVSWILLTRPLLWNKCEFSNEIFIKDRHLCEPSRGDVLESVVPFFYILKTRKSKTLSSLYITHLSCDQHQNLLLVDKGCYLTVCEVLRSRKLQNSFYSDFSIL